MTTTNHAAHSAQMPEMQSCIAACLDCFQKCAYCAGQCIGEAMMVDCLRACLDCTVTCQTCVTLMSYESPLHFQSCGLCASACARCAAECEKHDAEHCKKCAEACRRCEKECRQMAAMLPENDLSVETPIIPGSLA